MRDDELRVAERQLAAREVREARHLADASDRLVLATRGSRPLKEAA